MKTMQTTHEILYSNYDDSWQKIYFDTMSKGFVVAHNEHGKDELPINKEIAIRLATHFGERIELLPNSNLHGVKSADSTRNGEIWEWKKIIGSASSVQARLRKGSTQSPKILLTLPDVIDEAEILRGLMSAVNTDVKMRIQIVDFLFSNNKLVRLDRDKIRKRDFKLFFEALK
jgi:hypothetical protein